MDNYSITYKENVFYIDDNNDLYRVTEDSKTLMYSHVKSIIDVSLDEVKFVVHFIDLTLILYEDPKYESCRLTCSTFYNFIQSITVAKQFISYGDLFTAYITTDNELITYEDYDYIKVKIKVECVRYVYYMHAVHTYLLDGSLVVQHSNKKYKTLKIENPKKPFTSSDPN